MFCGNCGAQIQDGLPFCPSCGAQLAPVPQPRRASSNAPLFWISFALALSCIPLIPLGRYYPGGLLDLGFHPLNEMGFLISLNALAALFLMLPKLKICEKNLTHYFLAACFAALAFLTIVLDWLYLGYVISVFGIFVILLEMGATVCFVLLFVFEKKLQKKDA